MSKITQLGEFHRANGAEWIEIDGWLLPAHFGDPEAEYRAVRSSVGLLDLSHRALLQFSGPDRLSFLQGMLSNDLRLLQPFEGQHAALLTQQGKVIADLRVLCALNSFYLDFWESLKSKVIDHLNRYLVADEVEIADRSTEYSTLSLQGPCSEELLRKFVGSANLPGKIAAHSMVAIEGYAVCLVRANRTGETGFDLIVPAAGLNRVALLLTDGGRALSAAWIGELAQNILRVEAGIPRYGVDFTEDNLLLEVSLEHAVSFNKGCYLGQEVVERIRSRGHVNRKLLGLLLAGREAAAAGDALYAGGKEIGKITSSVVSARLGRAVALGYLHRDYWAPGTEVSVDRGGKEIKATVASIPFSNSP